MAEKANPFSRIQIEYRRSSPVTKIVAVAAILLSMMALITLRWAQSDIDAQTSDMKAEASRLEQDNAELERKIDQLGSVQSCLDDLVHQGDDHDADDQDQKGGNQTGGQSGNTGGHQCFKPVKHTDCSFAYKIWMTYYTRFCCVWQELKLS